MKERRRIDRRQLRQGFRKPYRANGCGIMDKARYLYNQAKDFSNSETFANMLNAIPSSDASARPVFAGEKHAILQLSNGKNGIANFMGPGTQVIKRLERGDPPRTESDAVAKRHDIDYVLASGEPTLEDQLKAVRLADSRMVKSLERIEKSKGDAGRNIFLGKNLIKAKMMGEDIGVLSKKEFAGPLVKLSDKEKDILLTNQAKLAQDGYGRKRPGDDLKQMLIKKFGKPTYGASSSRTLPDSKPFKMLGAGEIPDGIPDIAVVLKNKVLPNLINKMGLQGSVSQNMLNTVVDKTVAQSGNIQDAIVNLSKAVLPVVGMTKLKQVGLPPPQIAMGYKKMMVHKNKLLQHLSMGMLNSLKGKKQKGKGFWDDFSSAFSSILKPALSVLGVVADALGQPEIGIPLSIASELV